MQIEQANIWYFTFGNFLSPRDDQSKGRHGIGLLPEVQGNKPIKKAFKAYPIGFFHIDIAEVQRICFVLSYGSSWEVPPTPVDAKAALAATQSAWRGWISWFDDRKPQYVIGSAVTKQ